jgi:GGDEF domain-containing protein
LYIIIALLQTEIILALLVALRYLARDPNYGILTAAAGLPLVRYDRRRRDLILLDIDNFKAHNTAHGHTAADDHMRSVWIAFRMTDGIIVVKRGGDELVLSCPSGSADHVLDIAAARLAAVGLTATACVQPGGRCLDTMLVAAERRILDSKARNEKNTVLYLT